MIPRDPNDTREAPHCRRCGSLAEPDDYYCWLCGGEEMVLSGLVVAHEFAVAQMRGTSPGSEEVAGSIPAGLPSWGP